jgi:pimeloyl-ACP methyl ester carboxylesterase
LYVHGLGSHRRGEKALYFARRFNALGWAFASVDLRGHGAADGRIEDLTMSRLLADVARCEEERGVDLGGFTAGEVAALMGTPFLGAEELILLGVTEETLPMRSALRKVGVLLRRISETGSQPVAS